MMCAMSPGERLAPSQQSLKWMKPVDDAEVQSNISSFINIVQSSYGQHGKLKFIHNNSGGHLCITSCSGRLFPMLTLSSPILKLVWTTMQGHLHSYSDGGLFASLFALKLVKTSTEVQIHKRLVTEIYDYFMDIAVKYLSSTDCLCKLPVSFNNVSGLLDLVKSTIKTKGGVGIYDGRPEIDHIASQILQAFLATFPTSADTAGGTIGKLQYVCIEGKPLNESEVKPGVLFEVPHIPVYGTKMVDIKKIANNGKDFVKVALFNVSMAGDSDTFVEATYEMESSHMAAEVIIERMMGCARNLVEHGVGLLLCQKVVHPRLKQYFRQSNVFVVDRLGLQYMDCLQKLTGCQLLTIFDNICEDDFGNVEHAECVVLHQKAYLHLYNKCSTVSTLVLCNRTEESLNELKYVCNVAVDILYQTVRHPYVLMGAGCWQTHLAGYIKSQVMKEKTRIMQDMGCTSIQLMTLVNTFTDCLLQVAAATDSEVAGHFVDDANHHHWELHDVSQEKMPNTCACGAVAVHKDTKLKQIIGHSSENLKENYLMNGRSAQVDPASCKIVDSFAASLSAFRVAVITANIILKTTYYIKDIN